MLPWRHTCTKEWIEKGHGCANVSVRVLKDNARCCKPVNNTPTNVFNCSNQCLVNAELQSCHWFLYVNYFLSPLLSRPFVICLLYILPFGSVCAVSVLPVNWCRTRLPNLALSPVKLCHLNSGTITQPAYLPPSPWTSTFSTSIHLAGLCWRTTTGEALCVLLLA